MAVKPSQEFDIVVAGGTGSTVISMSEWGDGIGIIAPVDTPNFNFIAYDETGFLMAWARSLKVKYTKIDTRFKIDGSCTFSIVSAADDGTYKVKLFLR